jgi:hypothetical protein
VGIALGHGAGLTTAYADAVLFGGDLSVIPWAVALCRQVRKSIHANLIFAASYNGLGILLAATGILHPVAAALLMVVSSFTVSWRALRSTDGNSLCCGPNENVLTVNTDRVVAATNPRIRLSRSIHGVLFLFQIPFLVYLGQLDWLSSLGLWVTFVAVSWLLLLGHPRDPEQQPGFNMTLAMLGAGNWGMILGWWADLGFRPYLPGACGCGQPEGLPLLPFLDMPWMYVAMLVFGLPSMISFPPNAWRGLGRLSVGLLSAVGMVWGMAFGNHLALQWLAPESSNRFLVSFAGMTIGMLLGMFFCCELGRAIFLWLRSRAHP